MKIYQYTSPYFTITSEDPIGSDLIPFLVIYLLSMGFAETVDGIELERNVKEPKVIFPAITNEAHLDFYCKERWNASFVELLNYVLNNEFEQFMEVLNSFWPGTTWDWLNDNQEPEYMAPWDSESMKELVFNHYPYCVYPFIEKEVLTKNLSGFILSV